MLNSSKEYESFIYTTESDDSEPTAKQIDAALQGKWTKPDASFVFADGAVLITNNEGIPLAGTYEVNLYYSTIDIEFKASDGPVLVLQIPFTFENGALSLRTEQGELLEKQ